MINSYSTCVLCHKFAYKLFHFIDLTCCSEANWQSIHWFELLESHWIVVSSLWHSLLMKITKMRSKFMFICSNEFSMLLSIKKETKLRDRSNIVSLCNITYSIDVNSTENNIFVFISMSSTFINWFESHTRSTSCWPKVNDNSLIIFNDFREMRLVLNLDNFT